MLSARGVKDQWAENAQSLQFSSADKIRAAAASWTSYISSFLGVLGFASIAFVPASLKDVASRAALPVTLLSVGVILAGLLALIYAALAAQVVPKFLWADGPTYREASFRAVELGATRLNLSRWWAAAALACLLGAAAVAVLVHDPATAKVMLVYRTGQPPLCGTPVTGAAGQVSLLVGKGKTPVALTSVTGMQDIAACP
jgi:hypothetical protein